jgi:hypothetical protein
MRQSTRAVIKALDGRRLTARQIAVEIAYCRGAVNYALTVLKATDQISIVDEDALTPVYQLTGEVCPCCGQVIR